MSQNTTGQVHHGADDNASGTAAVIEMAKAAVEARKEFRRSIVFMAFAGEEHGLLGSSYYVNHPTLPLDKTIAMINLDMVGRAGGRIMVDGLANAPSIEDDLKAAESASSLKLRALRGGPGAGASDDATFLLRKIPSINFFSGFHSDYHRPSDTWDKIDAAAARAWPILRWRLLDSSRTAQSVRRSSKRCSRSRIRTRAATSAPCRATARISVRCPISQMKARV